MTRAKNPRLWHKRGFWESLKPIDSRRLIPLAGLQARHHQLMTDVRV